MRVWWFLLAVGIHFPTIGMSQSSKNLEKLAQIDQFGQYNDIWGYVDRDGREYAILGARTGTAIYLLTDPRNPQLVKFIPGANSIWRDIKSQGDFLYVVADQGADGIVAIDMSQAPTTITAQFYNPIAPTGVNPGPITKCHNLWIDEKGYLYLSGCNVQAGGVVIFDVFTNPGVPIYVGAADARYSHDNFVRGDTLWSADINSGLFSVTDLRDRAKPRLLATQRTGFSFTHNCWLSDDGQYLFTTDERSGAFIEAYDVSNLNDIRLVNRFRPSSSNDDRSTPHNVHYFQGYLVTSWYSEGIILSDASRPDNLIEVGHAPTTNGGTGCWGAYPFLPSGLVLASDYTNGLFVFRPTYQRACYLEGIITEGGSGQPLNGVTVTLEVPEKAVVRTTSPSGEFKSGTADAGVYTVRIEKEGYFPEWRQVSLQNGQVNQLEVALQKIVPRQVKLAVTGPNGTTLVPQSQVRLTSGAFTFQGQTNGVGFIDLPNLPEGSYQVTAGKWGYLPLTTAVTISRDTTLVLQLTTGYADDFEFDLGWTITGDALAGQWVRGIPISTTFEGISIAPAADSDQDPGRSCYLTGNTGGDPDLDDVEDGLTWLSSPPMDLTGYNNPVVQYDRWWVNTTGDSPADDTLFVLVTNGLGDTAVVEKVYQSAAGWVTPPPGSLRSLLPLTAQLKIHFLTSDLITSPHLVEAAVDRFRVTDSQVTATTPLQRWLTARLQAAPNPFADQTAFQYTLPAGTPGGVIEVFSNQGQVVQRYPFSETQGTLYLGQELPPGLYWVRMRTPGMATQAVKLIKMK